MQFMLPIAQIPLPLLFFSLSVLIPFISAAPNYLYTYCPNTTVFPAFRSNINSLLTSLSSAANRSSSPGFNYTSTSSSSVYGYYLCRGDDDPATCRDCVAAASGRLPKDCPRETEAIIWYDECIIRYSNQSFFSKLDSNFYVYMTNPLNVTTNATGFNEVLQSTLAKTASVAARGDATEKFATEQARFSSFQTVYALGQCTPDLSTSDCTQCLQQCINSMPGGGTRQGARVLYFSCNLRYEIYLFYRRTDSRISPMYTYCQHTTSFPDNDSAFRSNINSLLSTLSSAANQSTTPGYNYTIAGNTSTTVYGFYLCRGDITPATCRDCVAAASVDLPRNCTNGKQAVILYEVCMIRYSNKSFFGELGPISNPLWSLTPNSTNSVPADFSMGYALRGAIDKVMTKAPDKGEDGKMFATDQESTNQNTTTLYLLGQCTPDLSSDDCSNCLQECSQFMQSLRSLTGSARVYFFSCNLRYELYQFYQPSTSSGQPTLVPVSNGGRGSSSPPPRHPINPNKSGRNLPLIITCSVIGVSLLILCLILWFYGSKMKSKSTYTADLNDIATAESLQMDLNTIRAATHNFAPDKKLGQGGFGSVYKGTLENGQDIAVKRLADNSRQGIAEFKAEVLLVAKLQHRNLVKLLGFCVSGKEIILVYEFLPNSSLDKILFDPTKRISLNWETRFKIICGIAKGLVYLHEDSRLRVVHRDLKSSNILLDETMNPKISDFGLAKLFSVDQTQDMTDSIAGTYGYMAPEYVLMGRYSIKSDVYSFGILVLEVVSGLRNKYLHRPSLEEALLYRAWRLWHEGEALKLVDDALDHNYSREDAMKCIHIGLLCIQESVARRPNMTSVVAALGGQSITLPLPSPPNFFNEGDPSSTMNTSSSGVPNFFNEGDPSSTMNTSSSGVGSGQGVSILHTSEITELHGR